METFSADPSSHLPYEVDWSLWMKARGYVAGDIQAFAWSVQTPAVATFAQGSGTVARVWIKGVPVGKTVRATCTITVHPPDVSVDPVTDKVSFMLKGVAA